MTGISTALSTVVDVRSYSRISALNALEQETLSAGRVFARYSAMLLFMLRIEIGVHQADGDADRIEPVERRGEAFQRR